MATRYDLILGLKLNEFLQGNKKAAVEFTKTKAKIEGKPIRVKAIGTNELLKGLAKIGIAYTTLTRLIPSMIRASNQQELADNQLAAALKNVNQYTAENFKLLKDQASAIQSVTVIGDEQSQMLQTLALNMGVQADKIDEVTKGAIGLAQQFSAAGLSQETAMKGLALAYQGNFEQLQRYIPALRNAETETEKMAVLQKAMADGFSAAKAQAQTSGGQMKQFSNLVGDLQEKTGDLIKDGLKPLIEVGIPVVTFLNEMDKGTRNAAFGMTALLLVLPKVIKGIQALYLSMGPGGWLIIGIGALIPLLMKNASYTERAAKAYEKYKKSIEDLPIETLEEKLTLLNNELEKTITLITAEAAEGITFWDAMLAALMGVPGANLEMDKLLTKLEKIEAEEKAITDTIKNRKGDRETEVSNINKQVESMYKLKYAEVDFMEVGKHRLKLYSERQKKLEKETKTTGELAIVQNKGIKNNIQLGQILSDTLSNAFVDQALYGVNAVEAFGNSLKRLALELTTRGVFKAIFSFIPGLNTLGAFLGYQHGSYGPLSMADIYPSARTPIGESGLVGVQTGEMIMNRGATVNFEPLLRRMNELGRGVPSYQEGGAINQITGGGLSKMDIFELKKAIQDINIIIQADVDYISYYRKTFPKYEKIKNEDTLL